MIDYEQNLRTLAVLGSGALENLERAHVAVFGVGGVGGALCEALARAGVGNIDLFDADEVSLSNINRQIIALHSTLGRKKVDVMAERIADINPTCRVRTFPVFYLPENADDYPLDGYDYVADAVDTVAAKLELAQRCFRQGIRFLSSMGTGNKLDPTRFEVTDIFKTEGCPLARVMRRELKKRGVTRCRVVFSPEEPVSPPLDAPALESGGTKRPPGSLPFVPPVAGYIMAGEIILSLSKTQKQTNGGNNS